LINGHADIFLVTHRKPRTKVFESSKIEEIRAQFQSYFGELEEALGFYPIKIYCYLLESVADFSRYVMFIGLIFDLVVALLVIISVLLIYSLLVINVETKTFDIGVQRMVGLTRRGLVLMVII
jgi:ABC-type antimicrobial peptide transport system permease subunit